MQDLTTFSNLLVGLATLALVGVTWRYVRLTAQLLEANRDQLAHLRDQAAAQNRQLRRTLVGVIDKILRCLEELPKGPDRADPEMRTAALWTEQDVRDLQVLSAGIGAEAAARASLAATDLIWLMERAKDVRRTDPRQGFDWGRFKWEPWLQRRIAAIESLRAIRATCDEQGL